ncbi:Rha family transcriptional regulator [Streptococcus suis]|uniref:Phage protein n=1 Tax=Streptococcus suis TaxID=1307 RepID=A0A0Z8MVC2_STRSU|nr:Rha family transcriptional regulator [Streptococcus suis]MBO4131366.1 Rha family transcriptional regulator [Streptococcus suis]MBO4133373.1 Rha family transcriptional regulator [Streptococcus suis]MCK3848665.1 Rha family transcriptional regulator [Streptococcus suis]MCK3906952.1 Rha family transcriptional regulator [Streptococcus suis]MCK3959902.1 Rha family transcriptional regulator [Streptococcus suis]
MELVYMDGRKEPYTLSSIVAECAEVQHHTITRLIREHKVDFENLGKVGFQIQAMTSGQHSKNYILNEQQATLLITYLRNTQPVREFKKNLVKAFFEMRDELANFKIQRALEKPRRKNLLEAIKNWENAPKQAYASVNNLLLKAVTGMNAKQLKNKRGGHNGIDSLTSDELTNYQAFEDVAIALINVNMQYADIRELIMKKQKLSV